MKKFIFLGLVTTLFLGACSPAQKTAPSSTNESSIQTANSDTTSSSQYAKDLAYAINNPDAVFPQLSDTIAENEAAILLKTSEGNIKIKLFPEQAPLAVENFLTHAKEGYYNGIIFHRVINDFMIQGGDPKGTGTGGESIWAGKDPSIDNGSGFKNEVSAFLYNIRGALSMANAGPDTNGSQFFINQNTKNISTQLSPNRYPAKIIEAYKQGGNPSLDGGYTVFGQVIEGMDVVDKIATTETGTADKPKTDIIIEGVDIIKDHTFNH